MGPAVHQHRAGAAFALVAAVFQAVKPPVTEVFQQGQAGGQVGFDWAAVEAELQHRRAPIRRIAVPIRACLYSREPY